MPYCIAFVTQAWPDWRGETVVIVASGPSAQHAPLGLAKGRAKFVAINDSWRLCPWADLLYACDGAWWRAKKGLPEFSGLKVTQEQRAADDFGLLKVKVAHGCDVMLFNEFGALGSGSNSGFQALNLVVQLGASRVLLVGYDMSLAAGIHWHGAHGAGLNNPNEILVRRWLKARWSVPAAVVNCSGDSALTAFPKVIFEEAIYG